MILQSDPDNYIVRVVLPIMNMTPIKFCLRSDTDFILIGNHRQTIIKSLFFDRLCETIISDIKVDIKMVYNKADLRFSHLSFLTWRNPLQYPSTHYALIMHPLGVYSLCYSERSYLFVLSLSACQTIQL